MKSDAEFRLEIEQLKWAEHLRLRNALERHAHRIRSSDESPSKKALTSAFGGDTLN